MRVPKLRMFPWRQTSELESSSLNRYNDKKTNGRHSGNDEKDPEKDAVDNQGHLPPLVDGTGHAVFALLLLQQVPQRPQHFVLNTLGRPTATPPVPWGR